jgi:hypothetical protein
MRTIRWAPPTAWIALCTACNGSSKDIDTGTPDTETIPTDTAAPTVETEPTGETGASTDTDADTGTPPGPCAALGTGTFTGPTTLDTTSVTCSPADDHVQYLACTRGQSAGGWVFAQETGNVEPNWSDAHTLASIGGDPLGWFEALERRLATAADFGTWTTDASTLFGCRAHLEDPAVMTFAFMAYDAYGQPADCVVWGEDPQALIDGTLSRVNEPPFSLASCRVLP